MQNRMKSRSGSRLALERERICSAPLAKPARRTHREAHVPVFPLSSNSLNSEVTERNLKTNFSGTKPARHMDSLVFFLNSRERLNMKDFSSKNGSDVDSAVIISTWALHV